MTVRSVRQRGSEVYGGVAATVNAQTMLDVRVIADFEKFVKEHGGAPTSLSGVIREVCYWLHEQLVREGIVVPCETIEQAVDRLRASGIRVGQVKGDRRNNGLKAGLARESMQADFGQVDSRASSNTLMPTEDEIRAAAARFQGRFGSPEGQVEKEREALSGIPSRVVEGDDD